MLKMQWQEKLVLYLLRNHHKVIVLIIKFQNIDIIVCYNDVNIFPLKNVMFTYIADVHDAFILFIS